MNKQLLLLILPFFLGLPLLSNAQKGLAIGFYNVENLFDTLDTPGKNDEEFLPLAKYEWNSARYNEKLEHINKVFELMGEPMIFGMCEIENAAVVSDVVDHGTMKDRYAVVHYESTDERGIDNALVYNEKELTLNKSGIIRFAMPGNSGPTRDILWAKLLRGSDTLMVMVNHWPSRRGGQVESEPKRLVAATAARKFIDSVMTVSPEVKIIFMGDLNDYPDNIAPQMVSSVLKPMIVPGSGTFGGSNSYKGEWNILDHIMVSPNCLKKKGTYVVKKSGTIHSPDFLLTEYKGDTVPFRTYGGGNYLGGYSDHLPVSIRVGK